MPECEEAALNIVFVLDESMSLDSPSGSNVTHFEEVKSYVSNLVSHFNIGRTSGDTQVALLTYAADADLRFNLQTYNSEADVLSAIADVEASSLVNDSAAFDLGGALRSVRTDVLSSHPDRQDNPDVIIVITSGAVHVFIFIPYYNGCPTKILF